MDDEQAWNRVRSARVGRMATVTPAGRPHVVPFVFALVEPRDDRLVAYWAVDAKPKRSAALQRIKNIRGDPNVEFVVDGYDEDWERLWWVRCAGTARLIDGDERLTALDALAAKYPQYAAARPDGPVVAIDIETISGWEGRADPLS